jgi:hypothetical protein
VDRGQAASTRPGGSGGDSFVGQQSRGSWPPDVTPILMPTYRYAENLIGLRVVKECDNLLARSRDKDMALWDPNQCIPFSEQC